MRISDWSSDVCSSDLFVTTVNAVHRQGVDLNGQPGADLFATRSLAATPSRTNVGQATLRMEVTDQTQVFPGGYELRYDGTTSQWTLSRTDGSASGSGNGPLALRSEGAGVGTEWFITCKYRGLRKH